MGPSNANRLAAGKRIALFLIIIFASAASIPKARAAGLDSMMNFHIPPSDLPTALVRFSRQAGLQVVSAADQVSQWTTAGVNGRYTAVHALVMLLTSTGLDYRITATGVVTIGNFSSSITSANPDVVASQRTTSTGAGAPDPAAPDPAAPDPAAAPSAAAPSAAAPSAAAPSAAAPDATTTAQTGATTGTLQEVVVTAERRATDIQTTPIAVTAIEGNQLQAEQLKGITDLQTVAPTLSIVNLGANLLINIRGLGADSGNAPIEAGVITMRDGLPNSAEGFGNGIPFFDIADVEVLRGPQGTFVGDNSTGGAILITSANPKFNGINGFLDASVATYSDKKIDGAVNLPVNDTLAIRLAFNDERRNSFYFDEGSQDTGPLLQGSLPDGSQSYSRTTIQDPGNLNEQDARLSLLWKPTENFQSLTKIELNTDDTDGIPEQPGIYTFKSLPGLKCPTASGLSEGPGPNCPSLYYSGYSGSPFVLTPWDAAQLYDTSENLYGEELRYTLPNGVVLRSITGVQEWRQVTSEETGGDSIDTGYSNTTYENYLYNEEVDLISPTTSAFSWVAGLNVYYRDEDQGEHSVNTAPPYSATAPAIGVGDQWLINTRQQAVFGQISWQFIPTLQLQVGGRVSADDDGGAGGTITYRPGLSPLFSARGANYIGHTPTGKAGLNWTPLRGQYFYIFYARGYKPGSTNLAGGPASAPETDNDYELGWKGTLANGHVQTQLGGYYMQYYNMLQVIFDPSFAAGTNIKNIPYSTVKGIEASMQSQLGHLGFNLSGAWNKSVLGPLEDVATYKFPTSYGQTNQCAPGVTPNAGNTNCTNYVPFEEELAGEELPYAPELTFNATLEYAIPLGSTTLQPRVTYSYTGHQYGALFQTDDFFYIGPRHLWNAYLDYLAGPWTVTAFATNFTNKIYTSGYSSTTGSTDQFFGNPRQVGLEVKRTF